jgi:hypothetical protein
MDAMLSEVGDLVEEHGRWSAASRRNADAVETALVARARELASREG